MTAPPVVDVQPPSAEIAAFDIDGRKFVALTERTLEQDIYVMRCSRRAGITALLPATADMSVEQRSLALVMQCFESGETFNLLAGVLVDEGQDWSPESAATNAQFFRKVKNAQAKAHLEQALVILLLGFMLTAPSSSSTSPRSSDESEAVHTPPSASGNVGIESPERPSTVAGSNLASGDPSFVA